MNCICFDEFAGISFGHALGDSRSKCLDIFVNVTATLQCPQDSTQCFALGTEVTAPHRLAKAGYKLRRQIDDNSLGRSHAISPRS